jgi:hypothetical protein
MIHYEQSIFNDLRVQFVRRKLSALRAEQHRHRRSGSTNRNRSSSVEFIASPLSVMAAHNSSPKSSQMTTKES